MVVTNVVAVLSTESFDDIVLREFCRPPDQVLLTLAADARLGHLVVVDPWRSWAVDALRRRPLRLVQSQNIAGCEITRVRPRRMRLALPTDPSRLAELCRDYVNVVRAAVQPNGRTVLISFNPFIAAWADATWLDRVIYFGIDDWAAFPPIRRFWPAVRQAYRQIDEAADDIFVVSEELRGRVSERAVVTPNGVSPYIWSPDRRAPDNIGIPAETHAVYAGTIDDRIDLELVKEIASSPAISSLIMAGPLPNDALRRRLLGIGNVRLVGILAQEPLAALIQNAAVGVVPHVVNSLTTAMSPLKLYEYLAAGLPVVATELPPLHGHGPRVHLCSSRDQWPTALTNALKQVRLCGRERAAVVERLSWKTRLAPVVEAVVDGDREVLA
jgi:glycosyltransferase involved in cell wall biosynthesis